MLGIAAIGQLALAEFPTILIPPPPPPARSAYKNIYASQLYISVTKGIQIPYPVPSSATRVLVNENTNVLFLANSAANTESIPSIVPMPAKPINIAITKPDGTTYFVDNYYVYVASLFGNQYVIYTSAVGEFNQQGWYLADYSFGSSTSNQFAFFIYGA